MSLTKIQFTEDIRESFPNSYPSYDKEDKKIVICNEINDNVEYEYEIKDIVKVEFYPEWEKNK